jgi:hypothetical protein
MAQKLPEFQPGAILHEVLVGAFRASGTTFERWCHENGITPTNARGCTFGQSRGPEGRKNLNRMIDAAGREFVRDAYLRRLVEHCEQLKRGAA